LVERTEHFVHDYARSLRRRRTTRGQMRAFCVARAAMDREFDRYRAGVDGMDFLDLMILVLDHEQAIEAPAGSRFRTDAAGRGSSDE
jgi:hypothetical protein